MTELTLDPQARSRVQAACNVVNKEIEDEGRRLGFLRAGIVVITLALLAAYWDQWRLIALGAMIANGILTANAKSRIAATYKTLVLGRVIKAIGRGLSYSRTSTLKKADFNRMALFAETPTSFTSEDEVSWKKENVSYSVHEIRATKREGKHTKTIFSGLIVRLDFNKNFRGHTVVVPDGEGRTSPVLLEKLLERSSREKQRLVELENVDFENIFSVYSTDDQEARYLLTPKLMELVLEANAMQEQRIRLAFVDNSLFVAIPMQGDRLEAELGELVTPESALGELLQVIKLAERLVDTFQLETRIWSRA